MGLIGESGAGKSTLGLAAMGYTQPGCRITDGEIKFDGVDLAKLKESEKRKYWGNRMTYVAQSAAASFNPAHRLIKQTTASSIRSGFREANEAYKDAKELYRTLNLPDPNNIGDRYPHQVSGGQLQRVMTAMAMCSSWWKAAQTPSVARLMRTPIRTTEAVNTWTLWATVEAIVPTISTAMACATMPKFPAARM